MSNIIFTFVSLLLKQHCSLTDCVRLTDRMNDRLVRWHVCHHNHQDHKIERAETVAKRQDLAT